MASWGVLEVAGLWVAGWGYSYDPAAASLFLDSEVVEALDEDTLPPWSPRDASRYIATVGTIRARLQLLGVQTNQAESAVRPSWSRREDEPASLPDDLDQLVTDYLDERGTDCGLMPDSASMKLQSALTALDCSWQETLRYLVERVPQNETVILDLSAVWPSLAEEGIIRTTRFCAESRELVRGLALGALPTIVLTEGSSDATILTGAMEVLRPQYEGFLTFMDYSNKPAGGVDSVVKGLRAFAAAGVGNQIVGLLDNDTAGAGGVRALSSADLPRRITVLRLPHLSWAETYPTLGTEGLVTKDVNGIAVSIEHFLGQDILTGPDGKLFPVQLTGWVASEKSYQGEITCKEAIKARFWEKLKRARQETIVHADWIDLTYLLDYIVGQLEPGGTDFQLRPREDPYLPS